MLSKASRLKKKKDFEAVFKRGKKIKGNLILLKLLPNNTEKNRFGIVIGKKVVKKAVVRNKIKRQVRAILREINPKIKIKSDFVVVFLNMPRDFMSIKEEIEKIFEKTGIVE